MYLSYVLKKAGTSITVRPAWPVFKAFMRRFQSAVLLLFLLSAAASAQRGALTAPRNIVELSQRAATIVHAFVVSTRIEPHPQLQNLTTVIVTMRVVEAFKGTPASTLTFRQFVWDIRDKYDAAGYRKGEQLLLLLNANSPYGLTSPVGMDQGRFEISRDPTGVVVAANGHANVGLFVDMPLQLKQAGITLSQATAALIARHRTGPVPLSQLEEIIRQFAGAAR
jgi:hypothetical protein